MANTDGINELERIAATLTEQVDTIKLSIDRFETRLTELSRVGHELDKRLSQAIRDIERLE